MNKISALLLVLGISAISACASNEVADDAASDAANETASEATMEAEAKVAEEKAAAEAKLDEEVDGAEADMAESKADAEDKVEEASQEAEQAASADDASDDSGNLVSTCTNGDQTRIISVIYDSDDNDTVCEVTYEKSTGVQTLWSANNERDYCQERAAEFVQKQEGWGWTCSNLE
jgi:hypothetical protein